MSGQTTQVGHVLDLRERTRTLSALAGYFAFYGVGRQPAERRRGEPERLSGVPVTANFFDVLGVRPLLGRNFTAEEAVWRGPKVVILGHGLWQRRFASDPAIVGTSLTLNNQPHHRRRRPAGIVRLRRGVRTRQPFRPVLSVRAGAGNEPVGQHHRARRPSPAGRDGAAGPGGDRIDRRADRRASIPIATASPASSSRWPNTSAAGCAWRCGCWRARSAW